MSGTPSPGHPLHGLRWGLLIGVVAAVALFAVVLVVESRQGRDGTPGVGAPTGYGASSAAPQAGGPGSGSGTAPGATPSRPAPSTTRAPVPSTTPAPATTPAPSRAPSPSGGAGPGGGAGGAGPAGAIVARGALAPGWETEGWSWDSQVAPAAGPDGARAYSVTYAKAFGGFALRRTATVRPPAGAVLQVRVYVPGPAVRLGLQVQSADDGGLGPVVRREVPSRRWVTLTATVPELRPPAGVRRVSVIAQGVPAGTRVWVSDVVLR